MNEPVSKITLQVRYRDLDTLGHVNNAVYLSYFELGRIDFIRKYIGSFDASSVNFVLAHVEIDFRKPILMPDNIILETCISGTGNTSFTFRHIIRNGDDGSIYCNGKTVAVLISSSDKKPKKLPDNFRGPACDEHHAGAMV